jgi:hypothetical protein
MGGAMSGKLGTVMGSVLVVIALVVTSCSASHAKAKQGGKAGRSAGGVVKAAPLAPTGFPTEALWSSANDWEPNVAAAPGSSWVYEQTTRYGAKNCAGMKHCIVFRSSSNGGAAWSKDTVMCSTCSGIQAQNDPVMKVGTDGTIYAVWMNDWDVVFSKSSDHGATWSTPIDFRTITGLKFTDKPWIAISPSGQDVYVAFNSSDSYVAASHNYGASFSAPVKANSDTLYWFAEGGAVAPNGTVYFSESAENQNATGPVKLAVLSSTNGGSSWTTTFVDSSQQQPACTVKTCPADFYGAQASIGVNASGTAMVVYTKNSTSGGPQGIYEATSSDGVNWSARAPLASGATKVGATDPVVTAGPTSGDFRVAWMDDRNGASAFNVWYESTPNAGSTWTTPVRLSNASSGAPYKTAAGFAFTYGDYFSMSVSSTGTSYVIWGEGPNYAGPGGTWSSVGS